MITQGRGSDLCGPTSLVNAFELLGKRFSLRKVSEACGEIVDGTDEYCLLRGADALGFIASTYGTHSIKAAWEWVRKIRAGILCVDSWGHWVTVHGLGDAVLVFDPAEKRAEVLSWRRLNRRWKLPPNEQNHPRDWTYFGIGVYRE